MELPILVRFSTKITSRLLTIYLLWFQILYEPLNSNILITNNDLAKSFYKLKYSPKKSIPRGNASISHKFPIGCLFELALLFYEFLMNGFRRPPFLRFDILLRLWKCNSLCLNFGLEWVGPCLGLDSGQLKTQPYIIQ